MSIRSKVLVIILVFILLIMALNYFIFNLGNNIILDNNEQKAMVTAEKLASLISGFVESKHNIIKTLAFDERSKSTNINYLNDAKIQMAEDLKDFLILYISDKNGDYSTTENAHNNISDRDYFKKAMSTGNSVVSRVLSKTTGEFILVLGTPIKDNTKNIGFVGGTIKLSHINNIINAESTNIKNLGKNSYAYLINTDGTLISHPNKEFIIDEKGDNDDFLFHGDEKFLEMHESMKAKNKGYMEYTYDGIKKTAAFVPIRIDNDTTWSIAVTTESKEINEQFNNLHLLYYLVIIIISAIFIFILRVIIHKVLKPTNSILDYLSQVAKGKLDLEIKEKKGNDEFCQIIKQIKTTTESLNSIVTDINRGAMHVYRASIDSKNRMDILKNNILDIANSTENLVSNMEETSAATEEIQATIANLSDYTNKMNQISSDFFTKTDDIARLNKSINSKLGELDSKTHVAIRPSTIKDIKDYIDQSQKLISSIKKFQPNSENLSVSIKNTLTGVSEISNANAFSIEELNKISKNAASILKESNEVLTTAEKTRKCSFILLSTVEKFILNKKTDNEE